MSSARKVQPESSSELDESAPAIFHVAYLMKDEGKLVSSTSDLLKHGT